MKYYAVTEMTVSDPAWVRAYLAEVTGMVQRHGGRYLARSTDIEQFEGTRTPGATFAIIEWPSKQAARDFYDSDEYRAHREARLAGSEGWFVLVAGEDLAGLADIERP